MLVSVSASFLGRVHGGVGAGDELVDQMCSALPVEQGDWHAAGSQTGCDPLRGVGDRDTQHVRGGRFSCNAALGDQKFFSASAAITAPALLLTRSAWPTSTRALSPAKWP